MAYDVFEPDGEPAAPLAVKLLIAGGFGVGKTTLVRAVTEIKSLHTEEYISQQGAYTDPLAGVADKQTTTVALDFGRITIDDDIVLYLFGTPRPGALLVHVGRVLGYGATPAVVILADTSAPLPELLHRRRLLRAPPGPLHRRRQRLRRRSPLPPAVGARRPRPRPVRPHRHLRRARTHVLPRRPAGPHRAHPRASRRHLRRATATRAPALLRSCTRPAAGGISASQVSIHWALSVCAASIRSK